MGIDLEALANKLRDQGENYVEVKDGRLTLYGGCAEDENDDLLCGSEWIIVDDTGDVWTGDDWPDEVMPVYPYLALIARHLGAGQTIDSELPTQEQISDVIRTERNAQVGLREADLSLDQQRELATMVVAADRAALVERIGVTAIAHSSYVDERDVDLRAGTGNDGETWGDLARSIGEAAITAVESAGWGPRDEPVAVAGETLYRKCPHCPGDGTSCLTCDDEGYVPVAPPEPLSAGEVEALALIAVSALSDRVSTGFLFVQDRDNWITTVRSVLAALPARFAAPVEGA